LKENFISVSISPDKMIAYINVSEPKFESESEENYTYTVDEILKVLNQNGVKYGIDLTVFEQIINKKLYNQTIKIAEGDFPVDGIDGRIEIHFEHEVNYKPIILEDGRVDYRNLNLIQSVKKGEKLCTLVKPVPGVEGMNVLGSKVPPREGKLAKLPVGKNVVITEDGNFLVAGLDGHVSYVNGRISVYPTYEVPGDIDNSTGNIEFLGNIVIRGNVLAGFSVKAGGNIEVWGVVEGAVLEAEGDIVIRRGILGNNKAVIKSKGHIAARFIERSYVEAANDIMAEAIMHSTVKCGGSLILEGKNGLLVGGTSVVGKELVAKVIGSQMASTTIIEVGVDYQLKEQQKKIKAEIDETKEGIKKSEQIISLLSKLRRSIELSDDKKELLDKSVKTKEFYEKKVKELNSIYEELEQKLCKENGSRIKCSDTIYSGVKITINAATMYVKEELQFCTLYCKGMDIKILPLS
jgi:uncharacterized protein (DUF342 family)